MVDPVERQLLRVAGEHVAKAAQSQPTDSGVDPWRLYQSLFREINPSTLQPLHADHAARSQWSVEEVLKRTDEVSAVGIDAGMTTPIEVTSQAGVGVVQIALAATASLTADAEELDSSVVMTGISHDGTALFEPTGVAIDGGRYWGVPLTDSLRHNQPAKLVTDYARDISESRQLHRTVHNTDAPLVMIDGPLYPTSSTLNDHIFGLVEGDKETNSSRVVADGGDTLSELPEISPSVERIEQALVERLASAPATRAIEDRVAAIDAALDDGRDVLGIVKTSPASTVLNAIATIRGRDMTTDPLPLGRDMHLFDDILPKGKWTATPWLVEQQYSSGVGDGHTMSLVDGLETDRPDEDYRRAFAFVRVPGGRGSETIFRVETVEACIPDREDARRLLDRVVATLARTADVPESLKLADRQVTISREERRSLIEEAGLAVVGEYNADHRGIPGGGR